MREILAELISQALGNFEDASDETVKTKLEDLLQAIAAAISDLKVESYPAETVLCHAGAVEDVFYVIARGGAKVLLPLDGERKEVATKGPGEFFGEMALVLDQPRSADVVTTEDSIVLELDRRSFKRAMRISDQLADLMSQRTIDQFDENQRIHKSAEVMITPFKLFTSYARANQDFVLNLVEDLQEDLLDEQITFWVDQKHIPKGYPWDRAIEEALDDCDAMLLVLSASSIDSENVRDEWNYCKDEGKTIIPVLIEDCKLPFNMRRLEHVNFFNQARASAIAQVHTRIMQLADSRS